jgi:hypothetical protein
MVEAPREEEISYIYRSGPIAAQKSESVQKLRVAIMVRKSGSELLQVLLSLQVAIPFIAGRDFPLILASTCRLGSDRVRTCSKVPIYF